MYQAAHWDEANDHDIIGMHCFFDSNVIVDYTMKYIAIFIRNISKFQSRRLANVETSLE